MDDAHVALNALSRSLDKLEANMTEMEGVIALHNRNMIAMDSRLHTDLSGFQEEVDRLHEDLESYKQLLLSVVDEFKGIVHVEQVANLEKHINALGFERALTREQVKAMIERSL